MTIVRALPAYPGSKVRQVRDLAHYLPTFDRLAEPFVGSASFTLHLLGRRLVKPSACWLNDINPHLMNYFEVLQAKTDLVISELLRLETHNGFGNKELFYRAVDVLRYRHADALERAIAYYVFQNGSFFGKQTFSYSSFAPSTTTSPRGLTKTSLLNRRIAGRRLKGARLTRESYDAVMVAADATTLLFLDPPYTNTDMYSDGFCLDQFAAACHKYKRECQMMITLDDTPANRERFMAPEFTIFSRNVYYQCVHQNAKELLIINYPILNIEYWCDLTNYKQLSKKV